MRAEHEHPAPVTHPGAAIATGSCPVLIVIVNYKTANLTIACLQSLGPEIRNLPGARVSVVENHSGDGEKLAAAIADRGWEDWVELDISDRNGGFAYGNNRAIRPTLNAPDPPRYTLLLNSDTEVRPGAIRTLIDFMDANPGVGIAGSSFENDDGSLWPIAFRFTTPLSELVSGLRIGPVSRLLKNHVTCRQMEQDRPQPVDWVAGACMIINHKVFLAIGLMDEAYFLYFEEVDFCLQAKRNGWPCWYVPQSRTMHIAGQSSDLSVHDRVPPRTPTYWFASRRRYFRKNFGLGGVIAADLAFGVGFALWRLRRALFRKPDLDPPHFLADFWKHSIFLRRDLTTDLPH
jgi:N-acetylglucosaminyl-diphospho-decaprenol L-rhamnosyltransferase